MNQDTQIERLQKLGLLKEENIPELARPVATWKKAMAQARDGDPSQFALLLTHARIPMPLADDVYRLIVEAPWRKGAPGGTRRTPEGGRKKAAKTASAKTGKRKAR